MNNAIKYNEINKNTNPNMVNGCYFNMYCN